ncbi:MAG: hypothetical protein EA407_04980 [Rhodobacteraceae bacterium]|nr:MAG: hypothetical protein EA407_04980 [Paracoccaceae bacterium]
MITAQDTRVLVSITRAGAAGGDWAPMLRELGAQMQADAAQFWHAGQVWDMAVETSGARPAGLTGLRLGRVYTGEELSDRALGSAAEGDQRALGIRAPGGAAWLLLNRGRGVFRAADSALLSSLAPHLEQALALAVQVSGLRAEIAQADSLARRLQVGRVRFGARGEVVARDAVARELLVRAGVTLPVIALAGKGLLRLSPTLEMLCLPDMGYLRAIDAPLPEPERIAQCLGLSLPEARLARALGQGASLAEAAQALGLTIETARYYSKQIFTKTGLRGQPDLMRKLWAGAMVLG